MAEYTDHTQAGQVPTSPLPGALTAPVQTHRGWTNAGLRRRPHGRWTFQATAGTADPANTFDFTVGGVSILTAPVESAGAVNTDATAIATAVNANSAVSGYYATVSTNTVTIRQRSTGAVTITKVVTGDAAGTLTAAFASSSTYTEVLSGTAFDGDEYYQLTWSGALVVDASNSVDLTNARATHVDLYGDDQAFQLWSGKGVQTSSNVILVGHPVAADTWENNLPFIGGGPMTIKFAADVTTFKHRVKYI